MNSDGCINNFLLTLAIIAVVCVVLFLMGGVLWMGLSFLDELSIIELKGCLSG